MLKRPDYARYRSHEDEEQHPFGTFEKSWMSVNAADRRQTQR
jgi:hypothetical protein